MDNNTSRNGIGVIGLLQITFIVLKLCGATQWSWLQVLSPIWISLIMDCINIIIAIIIAVIIKKDINIKVIKKNINIKERKKK